MYQVLQNPLFQMTNAMYSQENKTESAVSVVISIRIGVTLTELQRCATRTMSSLHISK